MAPLDHLHLPRGRVAALRLYYERPGRQERGHMANNVVEGDKKEKECSKQSVAVRGGSVRRMASRADAAWSLELDDLRGRVFSWGKVEQFLHVESAIYLAWTSRAFMGASLEATKRKLWNPSYLSTSDAWRCGYCRLVCDGGASHCGICLSIRPVRQQQCVSHKRRQSRLSNSQYGRPFFKRRRISAGLSPEVPAAPAAAAAAPAATFRGDSLEQSQRQWRCRRKRRMSIGGTCRLVA